MTARAEFENLLGRASWGYDEADPDLIARCFTSSRRAWRCASATGTEGTLVGPFEGRDAIRALHADSMAAQTDQRRHNLSNVWIEKESADEATVVSNLTLLSIENGAIRVLSSGWYRDQLVHAEDGTWLIADRYLYLDLPVLSGERPMVNVGRDPREVGGADARTVDAVVDATLRTPGELDASSTSACAGSPTACAVPRPGRPRPRAAATGWRCSRRTPPSSRRSTTRPVARDWSPSR